MTIKIFLASVRFISNTTFHLHESPRGTGVLLFCFLWLIILTLGKNNHSIFWPCKTLHKYNYSNHKDMARKIYKRGGISVVDIFLAYSNSTVINNWYLSLWDITDDTFAWTFIKLFVVVSDTHFQEY